MNFIDFVNKYGPRIWSGKHLVESRNKLMRFGDFNGVGFKDITMISARDITEFSDLLSDMGLCDNTVNHYKAAISAILKEAQSREYLEVLPRIKFAKVNSRRVRFLSDEEEQQLLDFCSTYKQGKYWWVWGMCQVALTTGMRLGEILSITPDMVEILGGSKCIIHLTDTKNGDDRDVICTGKGFAALQSLHCEPSKFYSHRKFYNTWDEARYRIAKNDKDFVFHILRHTAATRMVNDYNVPTVLAAQFLGHRSLQTTAKYVHVKRDEAERIAALMGS